MTTPASILIIEDDRFIGEMYVRSLRKAGYDVDWMVDGNDGLVAARNKPYSVILLDVMLPERRGSDILQYDAVRFVSGGNKAVITVDHPIDIVSGLPKASNVHFTDKTVVFDNEN
jgi:DNA-binding NtrC family response regulator